VDPLRDQIVCATNYRVEILGMERGYALPQAFLVGRVRPTSVAVGDLDRVVDAHGTFHDEIAVTYARLDGHVGLVVLNWELQPLATYETPGAVYGDAAVTMADLDGDGKMELALAVGNASERAYDREEGPHSGTLTLTTLRFVSDGKDQATLVQHHQLELTANAAFYSVDLEHGDFDGDGRDELALAYYLSSPGGAPSTLALFKSDAGLKLQQGAQVLGGSPMPSTYLDVTAGRLRFQPPDYGIQRRQLALTYVGMDGSLQVRTYDVKDVNTLLERGSFSKPGTFGGHQLGPALAAGNFVGLQDVNSPRMQLALNVPTSVSPGSTFSYPTFIVLQVGENLSLSAVHQQAFPAHAGSQIWTPELQGYDMDGDSYFLGAPIHATVQNLLDMRYVIQEPPKHLDCFPSEEGEECTVLNVSASSSFYVELSDSSEQAMETTGHDTTSWNIGGSAALSSSATVGGGFGDIASASVTASQRIALSYDYEEITETSNSLYNSTTEQRTETTNNDDQLIFNVRLLDIWRFPIYGLTLEDGTKPQGFYEVIFPGPIEQGSGSGGAYEWYQPLHQNKNLLSYPRINADFPTDMGTFSLSEGGPSMKEPLNERSARLWDGNQQTYDLTWTKRAGQGSSKSYTSTLRETVDLGLGFQASVDALYAQASTNLSFDFNFHNSNSWQENTVTNQQLSSSKGIRLVKPPEGSNLQAYAFETLAYFTEQGTFRVAHSVDPLRTDSGKRWWIEQYGHAPDPGLNLPNRFFYNNSQFQWMLMPTPQRWNLRGFFLRKSEPNPVTGTYDYLPHRGLSAGEKVKIATRVYNFSLHDQPVTFETLFEYEEMDAAGNTPIGPRKSLGVVRSTLPPRESEEVQMVWDTSELGGKAPGAARYYRFHITVDPANDVANEIHEGGAPGEEPVSDSNNYGFWPWNGGVAVFNSPQATPPPGGHDVSLGGDLQIYPETGPKRGMLLTRNEHLTVGEHYKLHASVHATHADTAPHLLLIYDGPPEAGARVVGSRWLTGLQAGENHVWASLRPERPGQGPLVIRVMEEPDDVHPGNALIRQDLRVRERPPLLTRP
jgi:hypothetical protein